MISRSGGANAEQLATFETMVQEDRHHSAARYKWSADRFFRGIDLSGKRVLEIGSGGGLRSVYLALRGAKSVVSLEPGLAGSRGHYRKIQLQRLEKLNLDNVQFLQADFNTWDAGALQFDLIVSESSINHLHESRFHALKHQETYRNYLGVCRKMWSLLVPGGVACISDACRYGLFSALRRFGVRRPWTGKRVSAIWQIHQNPGVWRRILLDAGFQRVDVGYPLPYRLRYLGRLVANPLANFALRSYFYLQARR